MWGVCAIGVTVCAWIGRSMMIFWLRMMMTRLKCSARGEKRRRIQGSVIGSRRRWMAVHEGIFNNSGALMLFEGGEICLKQKFSIILGLEF